MTSVVDGLPFSALATLLLSGFVLGVHSQLEKVEVRMIGMLSLVPGSSLDGFEIDVVQGPDGKVRLLVSDRSGTRSYCAFALKGDLSQFPTKGTRFAYFEVIRVFRLEGPLVLIVVADERRER